MPAMVIVYQVIVLLVILAAPFLAYSWLQTPFLGVFIKPNALIAGIEPTTPGTLEAVKQGLEFNNRLVEIDGKQVSSAADLQSVLNGNQVGQKVEVVIQARSGHMSALEVTLQSLPFKDQFNFFIAPYMVSLIFLGTGFWVVRLRRADAAGRAFAIFSTSVALCLAGLFDVITAHRLIYLWTVALALASGGLLHLALVFPQEHSLPRRFVVLRWVGYLVGLLLAFYSWPNLNNLTNPYLLDGSWQVQLIFLAFSLLVFYLGTIVRRLTSPSPIEQEQTRIILWGFVFAFLPAFLWMISGLLSWPNLAIPLAAVIIPLAIFPVSIAYAILRYRLINTDFVISQTLIYAALTVIAGAGYGLLISGLSLIFNTVIAVDNPFLIGGMVFFLALMLNPFRERAQMVVDTLFFRGEGVYRQQIKDFDDDLSKIVELTDVVNLLRRYIIQHLQPIRLHIFVYDQLVDRYVATENEAGSLTTDIRFLRNSGLVQTLTRKRASIFIGETEVLPAELRSDKPRLALLGAQLFVALPGQEHLSGWLALGPRSSGETYSNPDLNFLASLSDHASQAIERAQVLADKDRRVHEMNVLTRVAQGVNVTLNFDDILELLYAQTRQVIPADDFNITLFNRATNTLRHALLVENDDRLLEQENIFIPLGHSLEREVLEIRRPIITEDYEQESRNRRIVPAKKGVFAWMGVPLNAGDEIIGVMAVGSRNPAVLYTEDQYNILQAIADQAAGAIVKANLLEESERRTAQLASLNEVTRGLTSTLELDMLLNSILSSAVEILNCEAGSLLLLEEETGELIYEVVVSPVAEHFLGKRLEPGVGLAGKAVLEMKPMIVNNVEQSSDWFSKPDEFTGFVTRGMLVIPMVYKENVIGVIEVLNKKDGMPFDLDDQELLTAFASQAAVAVENVRLYTQTDDELTSRVEELSVMQRIDRELNTSLDVSKAMVITLGWAMRQSKSTAGLVGMVEGESLRVVASEGYTQQLDVYEEGIIPLTLPALSEAVSVGRLQRVDSVHLSESSALLDDARSQLVVPIRREIDVIGLLLLESREQDSYDEEDIAFLTRLSDHASIAIANAQLYSEVQRANLAKSDFVSFVSHELKTPMTSIKGYADLLSAGAVGEVSEAQTEFLATIRTNIDRMATLVSDLADVSRIEAGRLHLEFNAVSMQSVVDEVVSSTQRLMDEKNHEIIIDIPGSLPQVWGDRNRLVQILTNLVSNANKYTPEGGRITIQALQSDNQWDPEGAPQVVRIMVTDSGIGIKPEDQKKVFSQYFRTEEGKDTAPGTGLGLNITRYLVEMQGGKIWFDSVFDQGSTFQFTIPATEAEL